MSFANPAAFWLLLLAIPMIAVSLKFSGPVRHRVSFSTFWLSPAEQSNPAMSRQAWLRFPLSLLLQTALLCCLAVNAADPVPETSKPTSIVPEVNDVILIIDNSASMQATDITPSRFERARESALRIIRNASDTCRITLIPSVPNSDRQFSFCSDRLLLQQWLNQLEPADAPEDQNYLHQRLKAAAVVAPEARLIVLSDHQLISDQQEFTADHILLNGNGANVGIINYTATLSSDVSELAMIRLDVQNSAGQPVQCQLNTWTITGLSNRNQVDSRSISLQPEEVLPLEFSVAVGNANAVFSEIKVHSAGSNQLRVDDAAHGVLPSRQKVPILAVTTNRFLEEAVRAVPWVKVSIASEIPDKWPTEGIIILDSPRFAGSDSAINPLSLPNLPVIVINPQSVPPDMQTGGANWIVRSMDLADPDVVLRPSFPLLISQLIFESADQTTGTLPPLTAGSRKFLFEQLISGETFNQLGESIPPYYRTGIQTLGSQRVGVNLNSSVESDLRLVDSLVSKNSPDIPTEIQQQMSTADYADRIAAVLGTLTLIFMSVEWYLFQKQRI